MKLDIIGDIHGCAEELVSLLEKLGYSKQDGFYKHPDRTVLFIGDYIDRGFRNFETVRIVRAMVEARTARAIMGNHEHNAIGFHTTDRKSNGMPLREHSKDNINQHQSFLDEASRFPDEAKAVLAWFKTLPLFIEVNGARFVHACWHQPTIDKIRTRLNPDNSMSEEFLLSSFEKQADANAAIEMLLKGPEHSLPTGVEFTDKGGKKRTKARLAWWKSPPLKLKEGLINIPDTDCLPDEDMPVKSFTGFETSVSSPLIFIGHYWESGTPTPLSPKVACVDYSVAKGGALCCYRWDGETDFRTDKYVIVQSVEI